MPLNFYILFLFLSKTANILVSFFALTLYTQK